MSRTPSPPRRFVWFGAIAESYGAPPKLTALEFVEWVHHQYRRPELQPELLPGEIAALRANILSAIPEEEKER